MRVFAAVLALACVLPACRFEGLAFRQDRRVLISAPEDRAELELPVVVRWTVKDFDIAPGRGHFGIFIDRAPQAPGDDLSAIFSRDPTCRPAAECVTKERLAQEGIYQTTRTSHRIEEIGRRTGVSRDLEDVHEVTIVLLDSDGRRVGESGATVNFSLDRERI